MRINTLQGHTLGLGLIQIGRAWGSNPKDVPLSQDESAALIRAAMDHGIRFFDTAPAYGSSEAKLGQALSSVNSPALVATKFGEHWDAENRSTLTDHSASAILSSTSRSLELLGKFDLLQIHKCDRQVLKSEAVLDLISIFRGLGVAVGASVGDPDGLDAVMSHGGFDAVQFSLSIKDQRFAAASNDVALAGVMPIINRPFAMGGIELSGPDDRRNAFDFIGRHVSTAVVLTGTASMAHLSENVRAFEDVFGSLSANVD